MLVHGDVEASVLWPWDMLHWLFTAGKFNQWVSDDPGLAPDKVAQYWRRCRHLEFFQELQLDERDFDRTVPIFWHTDGVRVYRAQKAWIYSYSSACRKGESIQTKLVYTLIHETSIRKFCTHDCVAKHIGYITDVLATGRFPLADENGHPFAEGTPQCLKAGTPIAGRWLFRFAGFKGDWEARAICHKFERNYASKNICELCPASRSGENSFGNFHPDAPYRSVSWTHEEYIGMCSRHRVSAWTHVRGWRRERNLEDPRLIENGLLPSYFILFLSPSKQ